MGVTAVDFGFSQYKSLLSDMLGAQSVELRDGKKGPRGVVNPGDVLVYRKADGRLVHTTLSETRYQTARMQLSVVKATRDFASANVGFSGRWKDDKVNTALWSLKYSGEMSVRAGQKPSEAIADIFKNGRSYAFECATGTMVILYKAILDRVGPDDFDAAFPRLKIKRWDNKPELFKAAERVGDLPGYMAGDHTYFKNPDFAPEHSAWQGENVIYLGDGQYFGHGVGYATEDDVLDTLDALRKPDATTPAFRDDFELRLDGKKIAALDLTGG